MAQTGQTLSELTAICAVATTLVNVRLSDMQDPYDFPELVESFKKAETKLENVGRLLIRKSGTEPVIRVMVEHQDSSECERLANELANKVKAVMQ